MVPTEVGHILRTFYSARYPHFEFCVIYRPWLLTSFSAAACIGGGPGSYHFDLETVRHWRWDLSDAIPVVTLFTTRPHSILLSLLDDSWRGVMGIAWRGISVRGLAWDKSDMYNIWTASAVGAM